MPSDFAVANFQAASKAGSSTQANNEPAQEFIRARQEEARAEKERLLKAYDYVSKTGAGKMAVAKWADSELTFDL